MRKGLDCDYDKRHIYLVICDTDNEIIVYKTKKI